MTSKTIAGILGMVCALASLHAEERSFKAAANVAGGFEVEGPSSLKAQGKPLDVADVSARAGKADGFDVRVDGVSVFGMEYAHRTGRREPLRPLAADLSDWKKAPDCPPDRVQIDPRSGRVRFFAGNDPSGFQSRVLARFRGTHGDNAIAHWRGDTLFLSHWEASFHIWAYDVHNPSAPEKIGELTVDNFAHGFVILDSGLALMGTTGSNGVYLLDLRDPRKMQRLRSLLPKHDWLQPISARYVAVWRGNDGERDAKIFDVAKLPKEFVEVTESVKPEVRRCLAQRVGNIDHNTAWFRQGDDNLTLVDLAGEPAAWRILRTVKLPERLRKPKERGEGIQIKVVAEHKRFALLYPAADGKNVLQILDVTQEDASLSAAVEVEPTAAQLNVLGGKYAYVVVLPKDRGAGVVGTYQGTHLDIYDLSDAAKVKRVASWDPGCPMRNMELAPRPDKENVVLIKEPGGGIGIHFADFTDPLRPKMLASVPTNGEGNRVAAWGDKALYTSSTLAQWFDLSDPLKPKRDAQWFNHYWFWVRRLHATQAIVSISGQRESKIVDFLDPEKPRVLSSGVPASAAWGTRLYGLSGGPRSGQGPIRLVVADAADPSKLNFLSTTEYPRDELDIPGVSGAWADGPFLYAVTEGKKGQAVFLIWDVADPGKPKLLAQFRHPELQVQRGEGFWTAQGRTLTAARGVAVICSYASGAPQLIDVRNPRDPKFLMRLPYKGRLAHHVNEMVDSYPDGPWYYIKSYPDAAQLWDFSKPAEPRLVWEDKDDAVYGFYGWQAGVPVGPVFLSPKLADLAVMTAPRPDQTPVGKVTWR
jgi:hypothetical protein